MTDEELFLATLSDLRRRLDNASEYSLLRAAALLRQLLVDSSPLVHRVNREHRLRISFEVCGRRYTEVVLQDGPVFFSALGGIHKSGSQRRSAEPVSLDDFLKTTVMAVRGKRITVKDVISHAAHVLGGVHSGTARSQEDKALAEFRSVFALGQPAQVKQLEGLVRVVLDGLEPLRLAVERRL